MNHSIKKRTSLTLVILILSILCLTPMTAAAETTIDDFKASDYLNRYSASAEAIGDGEVKIKFKVYGTGVMTSIGASQILVQKKVSNNWYTVGTYPGTLANGMLASNTSSHSGSIIHPGIPGQTYRGIVTVYAGNNSGSDSKDITTNSVVAY